MNVNLIQALGRSSLYFPVAMILNDSMTYGDATAFTSYAMQLRDRPDSRNSSPNPASLHRNRTLKFHETEVVNDPIPYLNNIKGVDLLNVQFYYEEGKNDATIHVKPGKPSR